MTKRWAGRVCGFAAIMAAGPAFAATNDDAQLWLGASASGAISGRWQAGLETVLRFSADDGGLYEGEYGGTLGYRLSDAVTVRAGYLRVPTYSRAGVTRTEDRLRQQIDLDLGALGGGALSGRLRLEQRIVSTGDDTGLRFRPALECSLPLDDRSATKLVLSHESLINLNGTDWDQQAGYDRMRNLVAISTPLAPGVTAEFGYLNQYGFEADARDTQDHVASLSLSYGF